MLPLMQQNHEKLTYATLDNSYMKKISDDDNCEYYIEQLLQSNL